MYGAFGPCQRPFSIQTGKRAIAEMTRFVMYFPQCFRPNFAHFFMSSDVDTG